MKTNFKNASRSSINEQCKSVNNIMNQANRLMSECNAKCNFKRAEAIRKIAFRYFDNIRACAVNFNGNDDSEYSRAYSQTQYMYGIKRKELEEIADDARAWDIKTRGKAMKSNYAYMVLELMDTEEHSNNYCSALREVLTAFPEVNSEELEKELDSCI